MRIPPLASSLFRGVTNTDDPYNYRGIRKSQGAVSTVEPGASGAIPFGTLLRRFRLSAGLSQEALAERAGLSVDAIGMLERGVRRAPHSPTIEVLAEALELEPVARNQLATSVDRHRAPRKQLPLVADPLPVPSTPLIGRERELEHLRSVIADRHVRLLTITGTAGAGKTRLALETARSIAADYEAGVAFVNLASIRDPAQVPAAVAESVMRSSDDRVLSLDTVCARIGDRCLLIVVDNFEHVLPGASIVPVLLGRCNRTSIIATSREALRVAGEHEFSLRPLAIEGAVALLADRARSVRFELDIPENHETFAAICRRLDGLPLAIELAAGRLRHYAPSHVLEQLSARLPALIYGARDAPPRQQTMRDAISWSYDLLKPDERDVFELCSVFARGGTFDALARVCEVLALRESSDALVLALADKSLVTVSEERGDTRFDLLEVIREYAAERLSATPRLGICRRACARYYADFVHRIAPGLRGPNANALLEKLERDYQNVRLALSWGVAHDRTLGLQLALDLAIFWERSGHFSEPLEWLEALVDDSTLAQQPPEIVSQALNALGLSHFWIGNADRACAFFERAVRLARGEDAPRLLARGLNNLGIALLDLPDADRARSALEESLAVKEHIDSDVSVAMTVANLGIALRVLRRYDEALACHMRAMNLFRSADDPWGTASEFNLVGDVYRDRGDCVDAARNYAASLSANSEASRVIAEHSFEGLATLAAARSSFRQAAVLGGAADRILNETGRPMSRSDRARFEATFDASREALGSEAFSSAWSDGTMTSLLEAIEIARAIALSLIH